jgi:hypothetical protein
MLRTATGAVAALCLLFTFDVLAQGKPGQALAVTQGPTQTTADIMARQAATPPVAVPRIAPRPLPNLSKQPSPAALPAPAPRVVAPGAAPAVAQTFATNFLGARFYDAQAFPPDSMGAVGPSQFIVAINGRIRSFDKNSGITDGVLDVDTDVFFAPVLTPLGGGITSNFSSDPRIRYDRFTKRWFIVMIDVPQTASGFAVNRVMLAVSDTAQISTATVWQMFFFTPGTGLTDYPSLGIDNNALYIGANIFNTPSASSFLGTEGYVVRKTSVLGTGPATVTKFTLFTNTLPCVDGIYTPQGVDNFNSATEGYFAGVSACFFGELVINRVVNPGTAAPTLSGALTVAVPATNFPIATAPHLGNTNGNNGRIDQIDDRLMSAQIRNGVLFSAHTQPVDSSGVSNTTSGVARNGARWYRVGSLTTAPALLESGTVFDNTNSNSETTNVKWYSFPGINVNGQGNVAIGFTVAGPQQHLNAAFTGRLSTDPAGQTDAPTFYTNTLASYNPPGNPGGANGRRWGDFSYTAVDPDDDQTMWTIQEYTDQPDSWGVRAAKLMAPPPATPSAVSVPSVAAGTASATFTITGTSSGGSAFFDPGSAFANRIRVDILPGVTVTAVTVTDATHLSVTVSTVGTPVGTKQIRVTNPDGQVVTDGGTLFTVTGSAAPTITSANSLICTVGVACNFTFTAAAGPVASTFGVTGTLPTGVSFANPSLSGPPAAGTQGTYTLTVTASNGTLPNAVQTFTLYVVAACGGFTDIPGGAIYCNAADWLSNRGVTVGCAAGLYCPNDPVTRAQMALFMQRLGDIISPQSYSDNVQSTGALTIDNRPAFCTTPDFPGNTPANTNYPRVALITWSFEGNASDPLTARVFSQTSFDSGGTFGTNEVNLKRVQAQAQGWVGTTATVKVAIPAGAAPRFRLRIDREAGTVTTGNFIGGRCNIAVMFMSVNGGALPYDAIPVGPGEE